MKDTDRPWFTVYYLDYEKHMNVSAIGHQILFDGGGYYAQVIVLSILGPHSAVRGVLAALGSHRDLRCDAFPQARLYGHEGGRSFTAALSKEVTHGIYLAPELLVAGESSKIALLDETPKRVFERLTHRFAIPVLPEWSEWLTRTLKKRGDLTPLAGKGLSGSILSASEERLDELIAEGVREGEIRF